MSYTWTKKLHKFTNHTNLAKMLQVKKKLISVTGRKNIEEFNLQENCEINSANQKILGARWNDVWASKC